VPEHNKAASVRDHLGNNRDARATLHARQRNKDDGTAHGYHTH
jgi:hypothetical protein